MKSNSESEKKLILPQIETQKCKVRKTVVDENGLTHEIEEIIKLPIFDEDDNKS